MSTYDSQPSVPQSEDRSLPPARIRTRSRTAGAPPLAEPTKTQPVKREGEYEVGYGKPPRATQFKRGQSGTPSGRPKAAKGINTIVCESLTQKVSVRTANGEKRITRIEAVLHKTVEQAMKGNPRALAELIRLYGAAVPEPRPDTPHDHAAEEDLAAADVAILQAYQQLMAGENGHDA